MSETRRFLSKPQHLDSLRGRPAQPPHLVPRQPATALGWTMRRLRELASWNVTRAAREFGCSPSHISRVELHGTMPSRELVQFYEQAFEAEGLLLSLFEVADHAAEQNRRRFGGRRPRVVRAIPGDAVEFVDDTIPHGTAVPPGLLFVKTWRIRNAGIVPWRGRRLERQGPLTGPGLLTSPRYIPVPDTDPGETAEIETVLKAPTYACSSIAYFKMVDDEELLCFPDEHQLGLDVLVRVPDQRLARHEDSP
jgi:transcriptional regulator with XRE-family HTH domain